MAAGDSADSAGKVTAVVAGEVDLEVAGRDWVSYLEACAQEVLSCPLRERTGDCLSSVGTAAQA